MGGRKGKKTFRRLTDETAAEIEANRKNSPPNTKPERYQKNRGNPVKKNPVIAETNRSIEDTENESYENFEQNIEGSSKHSRNNSDIARDTKVEAVGSQLNENVKEPKNDGSSEIKQETSSLSLNVSSGYELENISGPENASASLNWDDESYDDKISLERYAGNYPQNGSKSVSKEPRVDQPSRNYGRGDIYNKNQSSNDVRSWSKKSTNFEKSNWRDEKNRSSYENDFRKSYNYSSDVKHNRHNQRDSRSRNADIRLDSNTTFNVSNDLNDSGNCTFGEPSPNDKWSQQGDVNDASKSFSDLSFSNKEGFQHGSYKKNDEKRKSESFINDRNEKKPFSRYSDSNFSRTFLPENLSDPEYREFQKERNEMVNPVLKKVNEVDQDLFGMPEEYSLGHCVAEDMRMGSGIAVTFKKKFSSLGTLLSQNKKPGGLAILEKKTKEGIRYIYYLVTKQLSQEKPTYTDFWFSLQEMRNHVRENNVKKLAIPKIGCGLDRLDWNIVQHMIEFLFKDVEIDEVVVCNFQQAEDASPMKDTSCKVVYDDNPVSKIASGTIIIYFSTERGDIEEDVHELSEKFNFLEPFKRTLPKKIGDSIRYEDKRKYYILYGCIVRKTSKDLFDFNGFAKCLSQINKDNKKDCYDYVAYQNINDNNDPIINTKIVTLLRNLLREVEVYVCKNNKSEELNISES